MMLFNPFPVESLELFSGERRGGILSLVFFYKSFVGSRFSRLLGVSNRDEIVRERMA